MHNEVWACSEDYKMSSQVADVQHCISEILACLDHVCTILKIEGLWVDLVGQCFEWLVLIQVHGLGFLPDPHPWTQTKYCEKVFTPDTY